MAVVSELFGEAEIARRVEELADEVAAELEGDVTVLGVLKGCFVFVADFIRALDRRGVSPQVEFMRLSSYGLGQEPGELKVIGDVPDTLKGRQVLLVDDIVDSGRSLAHAVTLVRERGATRVWTCALLDKPSRRKAAFVPDFIGFTIEDLFVVGYGIDHAENYRHLRFIGVVD